MSNKILKLDQAQTLYQDLRERIDVLPTNEDITVTDVQVNGVSVLANGVANILDDALIKKPTFGTPEVLVDTTTLSFHKDGDFDWYCTDENPIQGFTKNSFDYNSVYKIEWDGTEYEELAVEYEYPVKNSTWYEWTAIGNVSFLGNSTAYQSTAPFAVAYDYHRNSSEIQIFTTETSATHTVKITKIPFIKNVQREQFYTNSFKNHSIIRPGTGENSAVVISAADASGKDSFAKGVATIASGNGSHAEGIITIASGSYSHSEGSNTSASGTISHSEGSNTLAFGAISHAEGSGTIAEGQHSHAEGFQTKAIGWASHAEGAKTEARSTASYAEGLYTVATAEESHVAGMFNVLDSYEIFPEWTANAEYHVGDKVKITTQSNNTTTVSGYECLADNNDTQFTASNWTKLSDSRLNYGYIFGNGKNNDSRSNAYALSWTGDGKYAGHVYVRANADSSGGTMLPEDVQINGTSIVQNGVADIPIAVNNSSQVGLVKILTNNGISISNDGALSIVRPTNDELKKANNNYRVLTPYLQHISSFYGLAKAAGDTTQSQSNNAVGTYTDEAKTAIQSMLNVPSKTDTILDTTLSRGRKENTTVGTSSFAFGDNVQASGIVSHAEGRGTTASGELAHAEGNYAKAYGFASHAEGNYTEASGNSSHVEGYGTIARGELSHAEGSQTVAIGPHSHAEGHNNYPLSTNAYEINDQQYNLNYGAVGTADHSEGYDTIADSTLGGTLNDSYAAHAEGVGTIAVTNAQHAQGKWNAPDTNFADVVGNGTENARSNAYALTWSGDGKFAGNVYVGCGADSSGGTKLPKDVQINGTSVVDQNGVANIPVVTSNGSVALGLVKPMAGLGTAVANNGGLAILKADNNHIKTGADEYRPIVPQKQHISAFYGLAKAAGANMASSSNEVGTYTDEAKAAIQSMLGIDLSSIASQVEIPLVETVDGAAVTITGQPNTRYMCGEVTSISITPPAAGSIDVVFTSGSTVAVLTLPSTVKMPEWFDASILDTNTVYEILITDGVYGSVMTWAT